MKTENKALLKNIGIWKAVAWVSGVIAFLVCVLIIMNYIQLNRHDPVNTEVINTLVERLNKNPNDEALRNEIREFDLLARKAYFTNQWQVRTGGYLLLISLIIFVIAQQMIDAATKKLPVLSEETEKLILSQKKARKWVSIGGAILAVITLAFAYFTHQTIGNQLLGQASVQNDSITEFVTADLVLQDSSSLEKPLDTTNTNHLTSADSLENVAIIPSESGFPTEAMKKNFPSFRGPGGNGYAWQQNIPTDWDGATGKNVLWKVKVPIHGYNSPIIWGDKIFLTGADQSSQKLFCFRTKDGKLLWEADASKVEGSPAKAPAVTDDTGFSAPTATTDGEKVYAIFAKGDVVAVDFTGKILWSKNLGVPSNHYGHSSSLLVYQNILIVQYDHKASASVIGLSTTTGDVVWKTDRKVKVSWASPILVNTGKRMETILFAEPYVASYDPLSGKELWKVDCTYGEVGASVVYSNGMVFAMNEYAKLVGIELGSAPKILWEDNEFLSDVPSPVATNDHLFVVTSYGVVACYENKTGTMIWEHDFGTGFYASPILVENKIYLLDRKGVMHIFKPESTFELIAEPALGEKTDCTPAFGDGRIYIRTNENLYCIGK